MSANQFTFISVPRAAKLCGVSASTLHGLIDAGLLPAVTPSKQRRVKVADVQRFLQERQSSPVQQVRRLSAEAEALLAK